MTLNITATVKVTPSNGKTIGAIVLSVSCQLLITDCGSTESWLGVPSCHSMKPLNPTTVDCPSQYRAATAASRIAAETSSWLLANYPASRACWRRCCEAGCDFSAVSSAMNLIAGY